MRQWLMALGFCAGLFGAGGVGLAAIGAHRSHDATVTTAAYFLLFHAAALVGFCAFASVRPSRGIVVAASLVALGTVLFSSDLALRALAGSAPVRLAAPAGGLLMISGWLVAAVALPRVFQR